MRRLSVALTISAGLALSQSQRSSPTLAGVNSSGTVTSITACDSFAFLQMTTATTTQLVALAAGKSIRVCAYSIQGSTTATATTLRFVQGTGSNCATGLASITPAWNMPASSTALPSSVGSGLGQVFATGAGNALCATSTAAGTVNIGISFTIF